MAMCHFCRRGFGNQQAVRAHLRWCHRYRRRATGLAPRASESGPGKGSKFISFEERDKVLGERVERLKGYGAGTKTRTTAKEPDDVLDELAAMMEKELQIKSLRKQLRDLDNDGRSGPGARDERLTMNDVLSLFTQMAAALRPQPDPTLSALLPVLLGEGGLPTEHGGQGAR